MSPWKIKDRKNKRVDTLVMHSRVVALHPGVSASVCYGFVSGGIPEEVDDSHVTFLDIPGVIFVFVVQK